jgi:hypothetical protein
MLARLIGNLASAVVNVDARQPIAVNQKSGVSFKPGLGPFSEANTFELILKEAKRADPMWLKELTYSVPYPAHPKQKCDARVTTAEGELFLEGKLLRLKGDNGKPNDNMLMHILSPYPKHHSALTDCIKLNGSGFPGSKAIVIVGYSYDDLPLEPAVAAFEALAKAMVALGKRHEAIFSGLCHPVHREGKVLAWQIE